MARHEGINHQVADEEDLARVDSLVRQILVGALLRGKKQVGQGIGQDTVEFLRHSPVKAA